MDKVIYTFAYNRPNLLKLCLEFLLQDGRDEFDFVIFDDASTERATRDYLRSLEGVRVVETRSNLPRGNYQERAMRCAEVRRKALDDALEQGYDWIVLKDDDVLTTSRTIREAIEDFVFLQSTDWSKPGALTLHGLCTHKGYLPSRNKVFSELDITGEAHVIFERNTLLRVGNHFQVAKGGFADTQWRALRAAGLGYYTRVYPPYEVQHLGFGPGASSIHGTEKAPFWNRELYTCQYKRRDWKAPLVVSGFDVSRFERDASKVGGETAAVHYLKELINDTTES